MQNHKTEIRAYLPHYFMDHRHIAKILTSKASLAVCLIYFRKKAPFYLNAKFNDGLAKPVLELGHICVIISHTKQYVWLLIHVMIPINLCY